VRREVSIIKYKSGNSVCRAVIDTEDEGVIGTDPESSGSLS
jgi:hypothetical protein